MDNHPSESRSFRLLFVCTGNTCRSPMAEVIARHRLSELGWGRVEVESAGVGASDGSPASAGAVRAAGARGLDLSGHSSRRLTLERSASADLILTMSDGHLMRVIELGAGDQAAMITSFARREAGRSVASGVPDPIGGPDEEYSETFDLLDDLIERVLERLEPMIEP